MAPLSDGGRPAGRLRRGSRPLDPLALPSRRVSPRPPPRARPSRPHAGIIHVARTHPVIPLKHDPHKGRCVPRTPQGLERSAGALLLRQTNNQTNRCRVKQWPGGAAAKTGSRGRALSAPLDAARRRPRGPLLAVPEKRGRKRGRDCTAASASRSQEGAGDKKAQRLLAFSLDQKTRKTFFLNGAAALSHGSH